MNSLQKKKKICLDKQSLEGRKQINLSRLQSQLADESLIEEADLENLMNQFQHIIQNEPNVLKVNDPVTIIGDIHGQYFDLLKILASTQPKIPIQHVIFLGDYVDRGLNSMEVMIVLMAFKVTFPQRIIMLRGNHQSRIMTELYNFKTECNSKYPPKIYTRMMDIFDCLPLACIVNNKYFCVHGGISDKLLQVEKINEIARVKQIPLNDAYTDFIWSDPTTDETGKMHALTYRNNARDCSIIYGKELTSQFLEQNKLSTIIRGHQVFMSGYKIHGWQKDSNSPPPVMTIFSAPNYGGISGNKGAILTIKNDQMKIKQSNQELPASHRIANNFDAFSWTILKVLGVSQEVVIRLMDKIVDLYVPQLQEETEKRKISAFLEYDHSVNSHKSKTKKLKEIIAADPKKDPNFNEQEYLFSRSLEYFQKSQAYPKHPQC